MNKANETVKYDMAEGLKKCMRKTPIEDVTVKEICDATGISRQTFYRHFMDKYDLLNWYFDKLLHESFRMMGSGGTVKEGLIRKFHYIESESVLFENAFRSDVQNNLKTHDCEMIDEFYTNLIIDKTGSKPDDKIAWLLEMYCWASVHMTVKWVLEGMHTTAETLAVLMIEAMPQEITVLFEKLDIIEAE